MIQDKENRDDDMDPRMKLRTNKGDKLHDLQLLRDLEIINARTVVEMGPLPAGGFPVVPKRKPKLPASSSIMPPSADAGHQENETMGFKSMTVAASLALAACVPAQEGSLPVDRSEDAPLRKLNPQPERAYLIRMKMEGAPGPFAVVEGVAHYEVENRECGRYLKVAGTFPRMTSSETFEMTRVSETEYQGTVYPDLILAEDYFGRGMCRWRFLGMDGFLRATSDKRTTRFRPWIDDDEIYSQKSVTTYFWKERYPREEGYDNFAEFGDETLDSVPMDKRHEFFTITLTSQEVKP